MSGIGKTIHDSVKGIHGAGEALRGEINQATAAAFNDKSERAQNQAIANKGYAEMKQADNTIGNNHGMGTGHSSGAGAHSVAPGNIGAQATTMPAATTNIAQEEPGTSQRF